MTEREKQLIESYIRKEVRKKLQEQQLSEVRVIIRPDSQNNGLIVGGVGNKLYISQGGQGQPVQAVQFSLNQMRQIMNFFNEYDPKATTSRTPAGQRPRIGATK